MGAAWDRWVVLHHSYGHLNRLSPPAGLQGCHTSMPHRKHRPHVRGMQVREYMYQLEVHLSEAHRQAQRLIRQQGSLGSSLAEFGTAMVSLGKFEQGHLADGFINLGEKASSLAHSSQVQRTVSLLFDPCLPTPTRSRSGIPDNAPPGCIALKPGPFSHQMPRWQITFLQGPKQQSHRWLRGVAECEWDSCVAQEHADSLTFSFEAPLKEYTRMVKSAKAVMADRSLALGTLQSARSDVDAKRTKLAKLRGTPGIKVCSLAFQHAFSHRHCLQESYMLRCIIRPSMSSGRGYEQLPSRSGVHCCRQHGNGPVTRKKPDTLCSHLACPTCCICSSTSCSGRPGSECGVLRRLPQEEKVAEVERELNEAQHRVEGAKGAYELIVRRMAEELVRFQRERASELAAVLRSFAAAQTQLAGDTAKASAAPPSTVACSAPETVNELLWHMHSSLATSPRVGLLYSLV